MPGSRNTQAITPSIIAAPTAPPPSRIPRAGAIRIPGWDSGAWARAVQRGRRGRRGWRHRTRRRRRGGGGGGDVLESTVARSDRSRGTLYHPGPGASRLRQNVRHSEVIFGAHVFIAVVRPLCTSRASRSPSGRTRPTARSHRLSAIPRVAPAASRRNVSTHTSRFGVCSGGGQRPLS